MPTTTLYSFGQHHLKPPLFPSLQPCHPSDTSEPCSHALNFKGTLKPTFCPLALHPIPHLTLPDATPPSSIRVLTPSGSLIQAGPKLYFTSPSFDTQLSFHAGRVRPKPGTSGFGKDPLIDGGKEVHSELLRPPLEKEIIGVADGWVTTQLSLVLFSSGELRVLRYDRDTERFVLGELNDGERMALEEAGVIEGEEGEGKIVGIAQAGTGGPVCLLMGDGSVRELPWKNMAFGKMMPARRREVGGPLVEIVAGYEAIVGKTLAGEVWFWKSGGEALRVALPSGVRVKALRAGGRMGVAVLENGEAWSWVMGRQDHILDTYIVAGQGTEWLPGKDGLVMPGRLEIGEGLEVEDVSVGNQHLAAKARGKGWLAAGDARYGQLGIGEKLFDVESNAGVERGDELVKKFIAMDFAELRERSIERVVCGSSMTWVVASGDV